MNTQIERISVEAILRDARTFYIRVKQAGHHCSYHDYERFKRVLHDNGWFGYEFQLANILHM